MRFAGVAAAAVASDAEPLHVVVVAAVVGQLVVVVAAVAALDSVSSPS